MLRGSVLLGFLDLLFALLRETADQLEAEPDATAAGEPSPQPAKPTGGAARNGPSVR